MFKRLLGLRAPAAHQYHPPLPVADTAAGGLQLTYLGTAGFILHDARRTIVLDPYLSRPGLLETLTAPLHANPTLLARHIPHADEVLIGHAHYDHILDAPALCKMTGARLIGSRAACNVGRAAGLPEAQLRETQGREEITCGEWTVRGLPSRHGKAILGRVPFPGDMTEPPPWPPRLHQLKHGLVLNWLVDTGHLRIVHIDSAEFINAELQGIQADVVCLCAIGRHHRPGYVRDVVQLLRPRWIIPCHWDTMMTPYEAEPQCIPGVDLQGFLDEIRAAGVEPVLMPLGGRQHFAVTRGA